MDRAVFSNISVFHPKEAPDQFQGKQLEAHYSSLAQMTAVWSLSKINKQTAQTSWKFIISRTRALLAGEGTMLVNNTPNMYLVLT